MSLLIAMTVSKDLGYKIKRDLHSLIGYGDLWGFNHF